MFGKSICSRFRYAATRFGSDNRGNIATIFAITLVPLLSFVGAAVDYTRANTARSSMQAALDSTALMISKDVAATPNMTAAQVTSAAQKYFAALYHNTDANGVTVNAVYTPTNNGKPATVQVSGFGNVKTDFMKVAGFPQIDFNSGSTSTWGNTKLRVALALDNTGSMAQNGKMTALQGGAKSLIDQLSASAQNPGDVYISIVPFATGVNLGTSFSGSGYIDWSNWSPSESIEDGWACGVKYNKKKQTMVCGNLLNNVNKWNGCVMDRAQNYDTTVTAPSLLQLGSFYPADQSSWCPAQLMPLSYDFVTLKSKIDEMSPSGATNQPIGLVWAWQSLTQGIPLNAPAEDPRYTYKKAIILLSDGLNTMDRWYGDGSNPAPQVDARQKILCDNIKAAGITVYSIQVNTEGDPQSSILAYCASGPSNFFYLTSASDVLATFNSIGASLSELRISQ